MHASAHLRTFSHVGAGKLRAQLDAFMDTISVHCASLPAPDPCLQVPQTAALCMLISIGRFHVILGPVKQTAATGTKTLSACTGICCGCQGGAAGACSSAAGCVTVCVRPAAGRAAA